jgi:hypothetical protein
VLEVAPKVSNYRGGGLAVWVFASFTGAGAERTGRDWPAWKSRPDVRHWQRELTSANPSSSRTRIRHSQAIKPSNGCAGRRLSRRGCGFAVVQLIAGWQGEGGHDFISGVGDVHGAAEGLRSVRQIEEVA